MSAIGDAWARIKYDIQSHPGTWVGVGVGAAVLIVAYLTWQNSQNAANPAIPANGFGQPDWSTALAGDSPAAAPTNSELQAEILALMQHNASASTPTPPPVSHPGTTGTSGSNPITRVVTSVTTAVKRVVSSPRLPTAGRAVPGVSGTIQNPLRIQTAQHNPALAPHAPSYPATAIQLPPPLHTMATTGHGYTI